MRMQGTLAESLVSNNLDLVAKRKYQQLSKEYNVCMEEILSAVKVIEGLDPKPAPKIFIHIGRLYNTGRIHCEG